jgi:outer membrane murein-binding lipoprotein Lpp
MRALALAVAVTAVVTSGCGRAEAEARRERLAMDRARLDAQLDRLEGRLLAGQARVRFWRELEARHGAVSQVACQNAAWHAGDMARAADEERAYERGLTAPRLAAVAMPPRAVAPSGAAAPPGAAGPAGEAGGALDADEAPGGAAGAGGEGAAARGGEGR